LEKVKELKKYEFLEVKKDDKSFVDFDEDFYIDPEIDRVNKLEEISKKKISVNNTQTQCDSFRDLKVDNETSMDNKKPTKIMSANNTEIIKNLAENSFEVNTIRHIDNRMNENTTQELKTSEGKYLTKSTKEVLCCLSKIDKGKALFVTKNEQIIKLPHFFLPQNTMKGNSFKITLEEIEKKPAKYEKIRYLQNNYFFK
jgi:hypothetical protein